MLHVDEAGKLQVAGKPRGRKNAIRMLLTKIEEGWLPELGRSILIAHGDCLESACELRELIVQRFPNAQVDITDIGPIIGAHTGPGMLAVLYWGSNR